MTLQQRIRIIVGNVDFEPGTSAPEVRCASNEPPLPPHLQKVIILADVKNKVAHIILLDLHAISYVI